MPSEHLIWLIQDCPAAHSSPGYTINMRGYSFRKGHVSRNKTVVIADFRRQLAIRDTQDGFAQRMLVNIRAGQGSATEAPPAGQQGAVAMVQEGGVFEVPVLINDTITLNFIVDSGASSVSIPDDVVSTLIRSGTITEADFTGMQTEVARQN